MSVCSISWGCNYTSRLKSLKKLQKRALRIVHISPRFASTKPVFNTYNISLLHHENIRPTKYQLGLFVYCYHYKLLPLNSDKYFCQGIVINKYNRPTRYSCHYGSYPARTKVMLFSVKCYGPKLWNTLQQEFIKAPTPSLFKTKLN